LLSTLPAYRRTTRYKSYDGSKPSYLALHEVDDVDAIMNSGDKLSTEWADKVLGGAAIFDASSWRLILNRGNPAEGLGKINP
jgi:ABC-type sulfate transport system substrate-binding protein